MTSWLLEFFRELRTLGRQSLRLFQLPGPGPDRHLLLFGGASALLLPGTALLLFIRTPLPFQTPSPPSPDTPSETRPELIIDFSHPLRPLPDRFPANTHRPNIREGLASLSIDLHTFLPEHDLVHVDDRRVWWESEHDHGDTEDDHIMHRALEIPLRRLIELVDAAGGTLKVQDAYRDKGIHAPRSLHKQGRAIDLTCDELGLEKLARLCWAAGFDWVYHEVPRGGGSHVHASVHPDNPGYALTQAMAP